MEYSQGGGPYSGRTAGLWRGGLGLGAAEGERVIRWPIGLVASAVLAWLVWWASGRR